jgi:radical SAM superfamily enzyme YgiQ (UPF0313 family)
MAKVTLINPNRMKPAVAPIALDYIADWLDAAGHEVSILDLCFSQDLGADVDAFFADCQPDLIGVTIRNTDDCYFASRDFFVPYYKEVIERIKSRTDAPIVLGGAGLSVAPEAILEFTGADYAISGEGERAMALLADVVAVPPCRPSSDAECPATVAGTEARPLHDIPGLVYREGGIIKSNPPQWMDLADLPIHSRRWLDNKRYFREGGQAGIETKRGCDRKCIFCADPAGKGCTCRVLPPAHVIAEIRTLLEQGIDVYHLCDCEFNIPLGHAEEVCRAIIESGLGERIRWYTYASPKPFTDELACLMVRAGCRGIDFGADSGDDKVLRSLGRDFRSDDVRRTAEICHRHAITFMYDLLIGGPAETNESVKRTIELMKKIEPDRVGVSIGVRIYNGTALGEMIRREGVSPSNPTLHGIIEGNESFLAPIYYLSPAVGMEVFGLVEELVGGDSRFLHASPEELAGNYNYNDNTVLVDAIRAGFRGAFWDILRRLQAGEPPV